MATVSEQGVGTRRDLYLGHAVDDGAFDYQETVAVECSQRGFSDVSVQSQNGVTNNQDGPFLFDIDPSVDKYLQLNNAGMELDCRIMRADGTKMRWGDIAALSNLSAACIWEDVQVFLNGHPFTSASSMNAGYKAYIETMLTYDSDARNTHLVTQFFHLDTPGQFDNMTIREELLKAALFEALEERSEILTPDVALKYQRGNHSAADLTADENRIRAAQTPPLGPVPAGWVPAVLTEDQKTHARQVIYENEWNRMMGTAGNISHMVTKRGGSINAGYENRYRIGQHSERFDMYAPICHDFFRVNNHIAPGNRIKIKFTRYKDSFLINTYLSAERYKLVIDDMKLHLHYIMRKDRVMPPIREMYLMNETQVHKQLVNQLSPEITFRMHNGGIMPKLIVVCMVSVRQAEGTYSLNPFNFHHYYMTNICLDINGEQYPQGGLECDFARKNPKVSRLYRWMFENTGAAAAQKGNLVSWPAFQHGCFLVPFDLNPDKCNSLHFHNAVYGYIDCTIKFAFPLNEPIYVIYETVSPKVVVNDKLSNTLAILDVHAIDKK